MPSFCEKPCAMNLSLYPTMFPFNACWNLQIPHPRHHCSWTSTLLLFLLGYFFIAGRIYINDVTQECHITRVYMRPLTFIGTPIILLFILNDLSFPRWSSFLDVDLPLSLGHIMILIFFWSFFFYHNSSEPRSFKFIFMYVYWNESSNLNCHHLFSRTSLILIFL